MADPLAVVASLLACGQTTTQLSHALFDNAQATVNSPPEIRDIAFDLSTISQVAVVLSEALQTNQDFQPKLWREIQLIQRSLTTVLEDVKGLVEWSRRPKRLKWLRQSHKAQIILSKINSIKTSLSLVLNILQLIQAQNLSDDAVSKLRIDFESLVPANRVDKTEGEIEYHSSLQRWHADSKDAATWLYYLVSIAEEVGKAGLRHMMIGLSFKLFNQTIAVSNEDAEDIAHRCGWQVGQAQSLGSGNSKTALDITVCRRLGTGSIGEVDEIRNPAGKFETLARKKVTISRSKRLAARELMRIRDEIAHIKKLVHPHIVKIIDSYEEQPLTRQRFFCFLMYPVGNRDLKEFLEYDCICIKEEADGRDALVYSMWIKKWFTCLASALAYMHSQHIHHEDIKTRNIIHRGEHIYFTDFSSSRSFEAGQETSTFSPASTTRLFSAPETDLDKHGNPQRHGSKSDVFSLGLVFVEMLTVLVGLDIDDLYEYLEGYNGFGDDGKYRQYHRVVDRFAEWFQPGVGADMYKWCIQAMLRLERETRPRAEEVFISIQEHQPWGRTLACRCKEKGIGSDGDG